MNEYGLSTLELGDIDAYSSSTIMAANEAFSYWEENEHEKAREPLRISSDARYQYTMGKYAWLLYQDYFVERRKHTEGDVFHLVDLFLMGAIRGDEFAIDCVQMYFGESSHSLCSRLETLPTAVIRSWLRGECMNYPDALTAFINQRVDILKKNNL